MVMVRPHSVVPLSVLLALVLAGCSANPTADAAEEVSFDDIAVEATATTGLIRGIVVDERIVPIVEASIALRGAPAERTATSDEEGRFVFGDLEPGTYFLTVTSPRHREVQASAEVVAGVDEPPLVRVQMERLFSQDPYSVQIAQDGFFECSQAGAGLYSSSNCVYDPYRWAFGPPSPTQPIDNVTKQEREWHADVGAGWQQLVFEMIWEPTTQSTSTNMGIVVSTYKPERDASHWFAEFEGGTPLRGQIDVGVEHESASGVEPSQIPVEGINQMSYFVSVRKDGFLPGVAINQKFTIYLTMFHYGVPGDGWSFVNGDPLPF